MLNITFKGEPFLFVGDSLDMSGAITTADQFKRGLVSHAHYYPDGDGEVRRYSKLIGTRADIAVIGPAEPISMDLADTLVALDNMLGGDPGWFREDA